MVHVVRDSVVRAPQKYLKGAIGQSAAVRAIGVTQMAPVRSGCEAPKGENA